MSEVLRIGIVTGGIAVIGKEKKMSRTNEGLFLCWKDFEKDDPACRFMRPCSDKENTGIKALCWRNPTHQICWDDHGCFLGEPWKEKE